MKNIKVRVRLDQEAERYFLEYKTFLFWHEPKWKTYAQFLNTDSGIFNEYKSKQRAEADADALMLGIKITLERKPILTVKTISSKGYV